jgi:type I restriction enzyme S subunit
MKEGWEIKQLKDVIIAIKDGGTPSRTKPEYFGGDISWCVVKDIQSEIYSTKETLTELGLSKCSARIWPINSVIISLGATIGQVGITRIPVATKQGISGIVLNETILIPEFLVYFLNFKKEFIQKAASGTTIKEVRPSKLAEILQIPLPSLPEQQRIVSIIDKAFEAIDKALENTQKNLQNAKELFESYLNESINNNSWEDKNFVDICEISSKLIDPRKSEYQNLIHIGAGNIETKTGVLLGLKTAKEENLISGKFLFDESTVLYSKIRPYLIKVVNCDFIGLCSADIYPLKPFKNMVIKDFLYFVLLSKRFTEYAILGSQRAGMPKVNRDHLFSYKLKIPPLEEQLILVEKFNRISSETKAIESKYQQKLRDLEELKKSILNRAFAGEL